MTLNRYLGTKQEILPELLDAVGAYCSPGDHVVDIFSGSLAVSRGLKRAGYRVTGNDINLFSAVLAGAYLIPDEPPEVPIEELIPQSLLPGLLEAAHARVEGLVGEDGFLFLEHSEWRSRYERLVGVLAFLETAELTSLPKADRRTHFFDSYCEAGQFSGFVSSRGRSGRRRFFSAENAYRLDVILNCVRLWRREGILGSAAESMILSIALRATEKVANTQGTYHDFPRQTWDSRASKPLVLAPPPLDGAVGGCGGHRHGREDDSLEFIQGVDRHRLLYIDPPYNFRQYTAYYFLLNVICRYPALEDPSDYFGRITYVRGQNPSDDFTSSFCKRSGFIDELSLLITRSDSDVVLLSYFTGKNHWSEFDSGPDDTGQALLSDLLSGPLFKPGTLRTIKVPRTNYASYGGYKARVVDELLLVARRRRARGSTAGAAQRVPAVG